MDAYVSPGAEVCLCSGRSLYLLSSSGTGQIGGACCGIVSWILGREEKGGGVRFLYLPKNKNVFWFFEVYQGASFGFARKGSGLREVRSSGAGGFFLCRSSPNVFACGVRINSAIRKLSGYSVPITLWYWRSLWPPVDHIDCLGWVIVFLFFFFFGLVFGPEI